MMSIKKGLFILMFCVPVIALADPPESYKTPQNILIPVVINEVEARYKKFRIHCTLVASGETYVAKETHDDPQTGHPLTGFTPNLIGIGGGFTSVVPKKAGDGYSKYYEIMTRKGAVKFEKKVYMSIMHFDVAWLSGVKKFYYCNLLLNDGVKDVDTGIVVTGEYKK